MNLVLINQSSVRMPRSYLARWLKVVEKELRQRKIGGQFYCADLVVVFLNQAAAKKLNLKFRGKNYATDVLSFNGIDPDSLGELVLCPQVVERQAKEHDLSFRDELCYLVLHGVLHLLGFEHEQGGARAKKMYELQDEIFKAIDRVRR